MNADECPGCSSRPCTSGASEQVGIADIAGLRVTAPKADYCTRMPGSAG